jgi:biopolymer transport protein ExbB/TolQ
MPLMHSLDLIRAFAGTGGDWVIHVLVLSSVAALALIAERALVLRRCGPPSPGAPAAAVKAWREGDGRAALDALASQPLVRELAAAVADASPAGPVEAERALAEAAERARRGLERRLTLLGTLGNNAPFVGLLGTVLGVIRAFRDLAQSGGGAETVMRGLSEALVATAVGILVALPCVVAYNLLTKAVAERLSAAEAAVRRLCAARWPQEG